MTRLKQYFNSTTIRGRANVAKATYASLALMYIYYRVRKGGSKGGATAKSTQAAIPASMTPPAYNAPMPSAAAPSSIPTPPATLAPPKPRRQCPEGPTSPPSQPPPASPGSSGPYAAPPAALAPPKARERCSDLPSSSPATLSPSSPASKGNSSASAEGVTAGSTKDAATSPQKRNELRSSCSTPTRNLAEATVDVTDPVALARTRSTKSCP